jgi:tetratricopeptide (TPR) repeat protein
MNSSSARSLLLCALLALAACAPKQPRPSSTEAPQVPSISDSQLRDRARENLAQGVDLYNAGKYPEAQKQLQAALDHGVLSRPEQGNARKYLAFIHCASGREAQCRDEFRKALEIDPNFDLTMAEAGHPIWGPVYRDVRAKASAAAAPVAPKPVPRTGAEGVLDDGLAKYGAGDFDGAHKQLVAAYKKGLASKQDQITAFKTSAFSLCLLDKKIACRNEFVKIFAIDPNFDLAPAEAGHPAWSKPFADAKKRAQKQSTKPASKPAANK